MSPDRLFFRPPEGWIGDVIPYYRDGTFWLFYLHDRRGGPTAGTSWHLVRTSDFVAFDYVGEVLPHGGPEDPDLHAYTGSIYEEGGRYHLFYTGYNPGLLDPASGTPRQVVMHAVSDDLLHWVKRPGDTFGSPGGRYELRDWRDPFVFRDPGTDRYAMLLAARATAGNGPPRRRGCIALCASPDLNQWTVEDPFWSPSLYVTHECPDLFRMGGWWYLVYSEFTERFATRYRMSRDLHSPWVAPAEDSLDGRAYYAAKTASDGRRRFAFGWIPTKVEEADGHEWEWGGDLAVHEVVQHADGTLGMRLPDTIRAAFTHRLNTVFTPITGTWVEAEGGLLVKAPDSFAATISTDLPDRYLVSTTITFESRTRECGLMLRASPDGETGYYVRLEPQRGRLVFDRWPRRQPGLLDWQLAGDIPHAVELERFSPLDPGAPHRLDIVVDGTACVTYLDGNVAMSARMYDRRSGGLGLFVGEGAARFTDLSVTTR